MGFSKIRRDLRRVGANHHNERILNWEVAASVRAFHQGSRVLCTHLDRCAAGVVIALLDVDYRASGARAACVLAESWTDSAPSAEHSVDVRAVEEYESGSFYRRELPCLLEVLNSVAIKPNIAVVDGYVWLADESRPGLGFHLYQALDSRMPIVGIAKTAFVGAEPSAKIAKVFRGGSKRPLFVTSVGIELAMAVQSVQNMAGAHRIPLLVAAADHLARSMQPAMQMLPNPSVNRTA